MGKTPKKASVDAPKKSSTEDYFGGMLTYLQKREVENALGRYMGHNKIEGKARATKSITLAELLPYLKMEHERWHFLKKDDMVTYKSPFMKAVY